MALTDAQYSKSSWPPNNHDGEPMTIGTEGAWAAPASSTARTRVG